MEDADGGELGSALGEPIEVGTNSHTDRDGQFPLERKARWSQQRVGWS